MCSGIRSPIVWWILSLSLSHIWVYTEIEVTGHQKSLSVRQWGSRAPEGECILREGATPSRLASHEDKFFREEIIIKGAIICYFCFLTQHCSYCSLRVCLEWVFLRPSLVYESPGTLLKRQILIYRTWESAFLTILPNDAGPWITFWVEIVPRHGTQIVCWGTSGDIPCFLCLKKISILFKNFIFNWLMVLYNIGLVSVIHQCKNTSELRHWDLHCGAQGLSHPAACGILSSLTYFPTHVPLLWKADYQPPGSAVYASAHTTALLWHFQGVCGSILGRQCH